MPIGRPEAAKLPVGIELHFRHHQPAEFAALDAQLHGEFLEWDAVKHFPEPLSLREPLERAKSMFGNRHLGFRADPTAPAFHRKNVRCFGCLLIYLLAQLIHGIAE